MWLLLLTGYALRGALLEANAASRAFFRIDLELDQGLAYTGWTFLVPNMSDIFIPEVFQSGKGRVGGCGAQGT